jgi:hypothetical protein
VSGTSSSGGGPALAGAGGLRASLSGPRRLTKAEGILKRFLAARWRTKLQVAVDKSAGRATADGLALATRARSPDRACVRVKIDARAGLLPHGTFTLLGGTGAAARLYSTASFRFRVAGRGPALIVGTLRAGRGRARGLPRKCARLAPK